MIENGTSGRRIFFFLTAKATVSYTDLLIRTRIFQNIAKPPQYLSSGMDDNYGYDSDGYAVMTKDQPWEILPYWLFFVRTLNT